MKGTRTCHLGAAWCATAVSYCIASYSYADNCGENSAGTHHVCATWDQGGLPTEDFDFFVDYTCEGCSDAPMVTLKSAAGWTVFSEVISSGAAANLGSVVLHEDVTPNDGDFSLNILNGTDPGAVDVQTLYLNTSDENWTGGSNLTGLHVSGDVGGAITLVQDSGGAEGDVGDIDVGGSIDGPVTVPGDVIGSITVGDDISATLTVNGEVSGDLEVGDEISANVTIYGIAGDISVSTVSSALALIVGDVGGAVTITDVSDGALMFVSGSTEGEINIENVYGQFTISGTHGLSGQAVDINIDLIDGGEFSIEGSVLHEDTVVTVEEVGDPEEMESSLFEFGGSLAGTLSLPNGVGGSTAVTSVNVNTLGSTGKIDLDDGAGGMADVYGNLSVSVAVAGSTVDVGNVIGNLYLGNGNSSYFEGTANISSVANHAYLLAGAGADLKGTWNISGDALSGIQVQGEMTSTAEINIGGDVTGTGSYKFTIFDGVAGDISISGDLEGELVIGESLAAGGSIVVDGTTSGSISIGEDTAASSAITLTGGLESGGYIVVNTSDGNYDANGSILVGPSTLPNPPNDITYDGCFEVDGPSGYGKLNGRIKVVGCHATADDLNVCYNSGGSGQVDIVDTGCSNQPGETCGSCP